MIQLLVTGAVVLMLFKILHGIVTKPNRGAHQRNATYQARQIPPEILTEFEDSSAICPIKQEIFCDPVVAADGTLL
jgi:hypothetical protein